MAASDLTAARLREVLHYEPRTGDFTWLRRARSDFSDLRSWAAWNGRYAGKIAGGLSGEGHIGIRINNTAHWAHRLAVLWMTGDWPTGEVDHWNTVKTDNRYTNLRDVGGMTNRQNIRVSPRSKSTDLPLGVYRHARLKLRPFSSSLPVDGKTKHLGYFATPGEAHAAFVRAKREHHAGCTI